MISRQLDNAFHMAAKEALRRRHELLAAEHLLWAICLEESGADILRRCGADLELLQTNLSEYLERQEKVPEDAEFEIEQTLSITRILQRAAIHTQSSGKNEIEVGDVIAAMYKEQESFAVYLLLSQGIERIDILDYLSHGVGKVTDKSGDGDTPAYEEVGDDESGTKGVGSGGKQKNKQDPLKEFTIDLNTRAEDGKIDPLIGRDKEISRAVHVLCRRRKNNPILVGEPGVGKTSIAEGLAAAIVAGDVAEPLINARIFALDMGALIAGTKFRGEFEERLKGVVKAICKSPDRILFIDEIHTIIGAGQVSGGTLDASNILKPALATGELRCIGSTTYKEYKGIFEKDHALARRFQKVDIDEPNVRDTILILKGLQSRYEEFHGVQYSRSALEAAAELSHRYIRERHLPDKAIDLLDESGAAARLKKKAKKRIVAKDIEDIVAKVAKIPPKTVNTSEREKLQKLEDNLSLTIYGQNDAIEQVVTAIKLSRSGLGAPDKPIGSFLFSGPTGVGKTELAKQLALSMGVEFLRFDMSEYMEKHTVSRLIGAPPGYVGFDQGGLLTDAVIKNPHAVVVLDEIEKAHPDLFNLLLQVMDHATLTDNNGRIADFRHVVVIMTTNAGAFMMEQGAIGFGSGTDAGKQGNDGKSAIDKLFPPEFRNRLDAWIPFVHLPQSVILLVVDKFLTTLEHQLEPKRIILNVDDAAKKWLAKEGYSDKFGARPMQRLIDQKIRKPLADELLFGALQKGGTVDVSVERLEGGKQLKRLKLSCVAAKK